MLDQMLKIIANIFKSPIKAGQSTPTMTIAPEDITAEVEIYTTMFCGFCWRAKGLLETKGVKFIEYDVSSDAGLRAKMKERSNGGRTVPQIFIDDQLVGGCDELHQLEHEGRLNTLLTGTA
jgi:glutaredoxin 3